ncbi:MAG: DNA primase DnaG [Methanocorpusculum sp.]|nr:DNA primase DnaG [Methanocorpusculum sp.]
MYSTDTTKYLIHIRIEAEGVVEKTDVVGAIFGQTEGLLGEDMDLRDLQRSGRVGRIDVNIASKHGKTSGELYIASSLDRAETAILAAALETIERIGPCVSRVTVENIEDLRAIKRRQIVERAKELLMESFDEVGLSTNEILAEVREASRVVKISSIGDARLPAGPTVLESDAIIILEGRADVLNLLRCGIKNTVAVEGTKVPEIVAELSRKKNSTAFVDGDRGGDLILRELLQVADLDYVAFSPRGRSVEDMTRKEIIKSLRNKVPADVLRAQLARNQSVSDLVFEIAAPEEPDADAEEAAEEGAPAAESVRPKVFSGVRKEPKKAAPEESAPAESEPAAAEEAGEEMPRTLSNPSSIASHAEYMKDTGRARVLAAEAVILGDYTLNELNDVLPALSGDAAGIIVDAPADQRLIDCAYAKGLKFVAAREFSGIVHRPVGIRLIPF